MAILWCGGEDIDFPNGSAMSIPTSAGYFRSGFARCALCGPNSLPNMSQSTLFPGGGITSGWLRFYSYMNFGGGVGFCIGFGKSGTTSALGIGITNSGGSALVQIGKVTSGSFASFVNTSVTMGGLQRWDIQMINYGATGTINVYLNGALGGTYTGNISVTGVSSWDSVFFGGNFNNSSSPAYSEFIVSDQTTLGLQGLVTLAPSGNGTSQQWSNPAYTNFNPTTINDANTSYTNTTGQDEQATINGLPSGNFSIPCIKTVARASATSGASSTNLKIGFNNTNNSTVAEGATHALSTVMTPYEDYFTTDPTSSGGTGPWGASMSGYQLELRSA